MFAFALWDAPRQRLFLARDRLGKKPIVYALTQTGLSFASEIGALLQDPAIHREIDLEALDLYLALTYVPSPWTMIKAVRKIPPAHYLTWEKGVTRIEQYWDVQFEPRTNISEAQAAEEIRALLEDSVRRRLISDVPLGAFLSGGIDSGTVVALMTRLTGRAVRTFSIGFDNDAYGELKYAREVAQRYGADHTELSVQPKMVDVLPRLVRHYGEPYGDGSAVPTYYVSRLAGQSVKVVLSGDGGDEVFGGYPWYSAATRHAALARAFVRDGIQALRSAWQKRELRSALGAVKGTALGLGVAARGWHDPSRAFERLITFFAPRDRQALYSLDVKHALAGTSLAADLIQRVLHGQNGSSFLNKMFYADHHLYLPDDILVKVDIASMANSLEVRAPFLDYRLVELSATLPAGMKVGANETKRILRKVVNDLLPDSVLNRPKVGFGLPIDRWMREDLYPMACDLLLDQQSRIRDLFKAHAVRSLLEQHKTGQASNGYQLWLLLFFELWCREILTGSPRVDVAREKWEGVHA